jgi:hypothetical protein
VARTGDRKNRTDAYLRDSIRAVNTRLTESVEKTLSGLFVPVKFEHFAPGSLCGHPFFPMIEGLAIGAEVREKRVIEQVLTAVKNYAEYYSLLDPPANPRIQPGALRCTPPGRPDLHHYNLACCVTLRLLRLS